MGISKDEIRNLIEDGSLEIAIEKLKGISLIGSENNDPLIILGSRLTRVQESNLLGTITYADYNLEINKISASLLQLVNNISSRPEENDIFNFRTYIEDKASEFVGRTFITDAIQTFFRGKKRGYFVIEGDPGIGKSAVIAHLAKEFNYVHHFNIRAEGTGSYESFYKSLSSQLSAKYALKKSDLKKEHFFDGRALVNLLGSVSNKIKGRKNCVILVDALDETNNTIPMANTLLLPPSLPQNIFFIVSRRKNDPNVKLRIDCDSYTLPINHDDPLNILDIKEYISSRLLTRPKLKDYVRNHDLSNDDFIDFLTEKSEGNFMFLRYILPEIEAGTYNNFKVTKLPNGLINYYTDHWDRIQATNKDEWFKYKIPVLAALSAVFRPISVNLISKITEIEPKSRIQSILEEFSPFLHEELFEISGELEKRYSFYHSSFFDFIQDKDQIDIESMHEKISDILWEESFF